MHSKKLEVRHAVEYSVYSIVNWRQGNAGKPTPLSFSVVDENCRDSQLSVLVRKGQC